MFANNDKDWFISQFYSDFVYKADKFSLNMFLKRGNFIPPPKITTANINTGEVVMNDKAENDIFDIYFERGGHFFYGKLFCLSGNKIKK